ncbi:MAG TPA: methyl-accepting chemotaxis protein [Spirochaetota bacterium]|nr:methyl-accepting chemotaxis protein [Spirochaetota bacterium]
MSNKKEYSLEDVKRAFSTNLIKVFGLGYASVAIPLIYFALSYIDMCKNNSFTFCSLAIIEMILSFIICYIIQSISLKKINLYIKNNDSKISDNSKIRKSAFLFPFAVTAAMVSCCLILFNPVVTIPVYFLYSGKLIDLVLINLLLLSASIMMSTIAFFISENTVSKFLDLNEVKFLKQLEDNLKLGLFTKILIVCLILIISILLNISVWMILNITYKMSISENILNILIIGIQSIVGTITISFLFARAIKNPIINMTKYLNELNTKEGDLTIILPKITIDELGDATDEFNKFINKINRMIREIKKQTKNLSLVSKNLSLNMIETASAVNQTSANIQSVKTQTINQSASVAETSATMEQITKGIQILNEIIQEQSASVTESSSSIEEMLANISSVANTLVKNEDNIKKLSVSSETGRQYLNQVVNEIQDVAKESDGLLEINKLIQNIASQTNLLAMNAAIEAAHAGELGKGFSVVADEVRKLAESSGTQAKSVSAMLRKIKSSIEKITLSTQEVLNKFNIIEKAIETVTEQENMIRHAMQEQTIGGKQILIANSRLNDITQKVRTGSLEMLTGTNRVINETATLNRITEEITNNMNEMTSGTKQITIAVNNVNELSLENKECIDTLSSEVAKFKVE